MIYTTKGKINRGKNSRLRKFLSSFIEFLIPISFLLITLGIFFNFAFFKSGYEIVASNNLKAKPISHTYQDNPPSNEYVNKDNNKFHQTIKEATTTIDKPLNSYINNYVLKEMRESIERKEQERLIQFQKQHTQQEPVKTNKVSEITSANKNSSQVWGECLLQDREGLTYSDAVILCKDGQKVILPIRR